MSDSLKNALRLGIRPTSPRWWSLLLNCDSSYQKIFFRSMNILRRITSEDILDKMVACYYRITHLIYGTYIKQSFSQSLELEQIISLREGTTAFNCCVLKVGQLFMPFSES